MRQRLAVVASTILMGAALIACTPKHKDAIIFGTNTTFAVDVSLDNTTQVPGLTVGYKRQEGVLLPLLANGANSRFANCSTVTKEKQNECVRKILDGLDDSGIKYVGKEPKNDKANIDAYSVFASFGSNVGASSGKVGINQFFATGLAARNLAANSAIHGAMTPEPEADVVGGALTKDQIINDLGIAQDVMSFVTIRTTTPLTIDSDKCKQLDVGTNLGFGLVDPSPCTMKYDDLKHKIFDKVFEGKFSKGFNELRRKIYVANAESALLGVK
jgi:hypothetical protein